MNAPAMKDPINEAILLLTEEADSLSDCHTRKPGDWEGEPEAKAHYDHVLAVVAALSKLRAPVADERAALQKLVALEDMRMRLRALHDSGHGTDYDYYHKALPAAWDAARAALASAPVAGETKKPKVTPQMIAAFKAAYGQGSIWTDRLTAAVEALWAASDTAPQASEAVRDADHPVFTFLLGEGPLHGVHFGERAPGAVGKWWWRKYLRAALSAQPGAQKNGGSDE